MKELPSSGDSHERAIEDKKECHRQSKKKNTHGRLGLWVTDHLRFGLQRLRLWVTAFGGLHLRDCFWGSKFGGISLGGLNLGVRAFE